MPHRGQITGGRLDEIIDVIEVIIDVINVAIAVFDVIKDVINKIMETSTAPKPLKNGEIT